MLTERTFSILGKGSRWQAIIAFTFTALLFLAPATIFGQAHILDATGGLPNFDARTGSVPPTSTQLAMVSNMGATAEWNEFGTPKSLIKQGGYLATGLNGDSAVTAAKSWIDANKALYRLTSTTGLVVYGDSRMPFSDSHAVHFKQKFGALTSAQDGLITVGITGTPGTWKVAYVSSSLTGDMTLAGSVRLSPQEAWLRAATDLGRAVSLGIIGVLNADREWTVFSVAGFSDLQRTRVVAVPTPNSGVRPAFETLVLDNRGGALIGYKYLIDAENGAVLVRENLVHQFSQDPGPSQTSTPFTGSYDVQGIAPNRTGTCGTHDFVVPAGQNSLAVAAHTTVPTNDIYIDLFLGGQLVAHQDSGTSPEAITYTPAGGVPAGTYTVKVCPFLGTLPETDIPAPHTQPYSYAGTFTYSSQGTTPPSSYPPKWNVFRATPLLPALSSHPWNVPGTDIRKMWCWESTVQGVPIPGCDDEVTNLASRTPWDFDAQLNASTFTTRGNNAIASEAWTDPLAPGATAHQPVSATREYNFPWVNDWYQQNCNPTNFVPGVSNDISAAVTNLFAMHNRMHDWSYHLGFNEENWNAQKSNFGNAGAEGDPVLGQSQAGAADGGYPAYLGRDNANMRTLPDGVSSITNMYLWQPIRGTFYAPCVDGDYDMAVIGHEYGHMIENRMIGKGANRSGHHAGAMGESNGDLNGMEILNEYGFVPVGGENPYTVGAFATGNKDRGIRNYAMNQSPLNFSDLGYDPFYPAAESPLHSDGEIWSATNFDIRKALVDKYNATHPASDAAVQRKCAEGLKAPEDCPGNRRWAQLMYDAYLIMPTAPTMVQARDAYLAADMMRFAGANQNELWLAFARRGLGQGAAATTAHSSSDTDPKPDFASPRHSNATVTFKALASDEANSEIANARIFVGHYEARISPTADTNPSTNATGDGVNNLDDVAQFAPGTYEFIAQAPGYGAVRFTQTFAAGSTQTVTISMPTNLASTSKGATATGTGNVAALFDDTENTTWTAAGNPATQAVTVDLAGAAPQVIGRVQVSSMLQTGQNRFTALRQFRIDVSTDGSTFTPVFTSPEDAFPGASPRPGVPEMILRSFSFSPVPATHVRLVVLHTQCTGQSQFHGVQDNDIANGTDCRGEGEPAGTDPAAASGQTPQPQNTNTRAAEFQVFGAEASADLFVTKSDSPDPAKRGQDLVYTITVGNLGHSTANGVTLVDTLPKGAGFGTATTTQGTCSFKPVKREVSCSVGNIANGNTVIVTIVVKPTNQGSITNTVTVQAQSPRDPNLNNNTATATTVVE